MTFTEYLTPLLPIPPDRLASIFNLKDEKILDVEASSHHNFMKS